MRREREEPSEDGRVAIWSNRQERELPALEADANVLQQRRDFIFHYFYVREIRGSDGRGTTGRRETSEP